MAEESAAKPTMKDVLELLRRLRYSVSDFQENIEAFFGDNEDWQGIKSRLALFEARFASLEVRLSSVPDLAWADDDINYMLKELREIGNDLSGMHQTFIKTVEQVSQRVM